MRRRLGRAYLRSVVGPLVCVALAACLPGGRLPEMPVRKGGKLGPGLGTRSAEGGPFRVVFAGPSGEESSSPQPQIVFSRPVRALGQKPNEPRIKAHFVPELPGEWEWIGTSAARFVPKGEVPGATQFALSLEEAPRSLDGQTLEGPITLWFSTPRPSLTGSEPEDGMSDVEPQTPVVLHFSQTIAKDRLERALTARGSGGAVFPFLLEPAGKEWSPDVRLVPREGWPDGEHITIELAGGARGNEGPLPSRPSAITFSTREPLAVQAIGCTLHEDGRCHEGTTIDVSLNGSIRLSDLRALVTITPAVRLEPVGQRDDEPSTGHVLRGNFSSGVKYHVEIKPSGTKPRPQAKPPGASKGWKPEELRVLSRGASADFVFAPAEPGVHFSFGGTYVRTTSAELAARAEETKTASAGTVALDRDLVMRLETEAEETPWWELPGAQVLPLPPRPTPQDPPAWASLKAVTPPAGPVLFGAKWLGFGEHPQRSSVTLQRSDLAMLARSSPEGTLVWITSLVSGLPLEGVSVEARDDAGQRVSDVTGKDGVVRLPMAHLGKLREPKPPHAGAEPRGFVVLFAQKGADWMYRRAEIPRSAPLRGAIFSDRGLYRPGETTHLKGVIRQPTSRGLVPVAGKELTVEIIDPSQRTVHRTETTSAWGTFHHTFAASADAPTGYYTVTVKDHDEIITRGSFRVEEYRPSSFSVGAQLDKKVYVRGDRVVCEAKGTFLYGGSMSGAESYGQLSRHPTSFRVPGLPGFTVDEDAVSVLRDLLPSGHGTELDKAGRATFRASLDNPDQRGPELVDCDVAVVDRASEQIAASSSALVHPGEAYVALEELKSRAVFPGQLLSPKVLTVTPAGERRKKAVHLELLRYARSATWDAAPPPPETVATCDVDTGVEARGCTLRVPDDQPGAVGHFLLRGTTEDPRGKISASYTLYPTSIPRKPPPPQRRALRKPAPEAKLEADKDTYEKGDTAHLSASAPFPVAQVLLTVEREGVLSHEVRAVTDAPTSWEVPIDAAAAPYVQAVATFVAPESDKTTHQHALAATTKLAVSHQSQRLTVRVVPAKTEAAPGEEMDIDVEVRTMEGDPVDAEVTLYAADEGTLSQARYRLPDPIDSFFSGRPTTTIGTHSRDSLGWLFDWQEELREWERGVRRGRGHGRLGGSHQTKAPSIRMGATSVSSPRRNFDQGAFFLPTLHTDEKGKLRAHVTFPEALSTYRVMAFAVGKGAEMGAAEVPVVTSMPLQIRPILPRVIRAGDRFSLSAMAANNGTALLAADVRVDVEGLTPTGPQSRRLDLAAGASERVSFEVEARAPGRGKISVRIGAGPGGPADAAELPFEVKSPVAMEAAALYGVADGRVDEELSDLAHVRTDVGSLQLTLSSSPLAGLAAGLAQLVDYPYGCTEQTTSRLVPLLRLQPLARALEVKLPDDLPRVSAEAVRRMLGNQQKDGGFGLWPSSKASAPWLSAYATWGLGEAARHGVPVDRKALATARAFLAEVLANQADDPAARVTAPFALDVLAEAAEAGDAQREGTAELVGLREIAAQQLRIRDGLPLFAKAHLLHALGTLGTTGRERDALVVEIASAVHLDGPLARVVTSDERHAGSFDSPTRTSALVLRALVATEKDHALVTPLALGLVRDRRGGTWRTTQETAWALLALDDYRKQHPTQSGGEGEVLLGGASVFRHRFAAGPGMIAPDAQRTLPLAELLVAGSRAAPGQTTPPLGKSQVLSFMAQGETPLFYQALLRYAPRELPTNDVAAGFAVQRRYYAIPRTMDGTAGRRGDFRAAAAETFDEGTLVLVEIELSTSSARRFVAVDDPIPGGFEPVDVDNEPQQWLHSLVHGHQTRREDRDDRSVFFLDEMAPGALRLVHLARATVRGRFVAPPAHAEEMYTPETYGRTGTTFVEVHRKAP